MCEFPHHNIALRHMISTVAQLIDPISEEDCLEICRHLGIPEEALTLEKHGTIGAICGQWLVKKNVRDCTPARFMEALLLTKGLGQYLSNLCCKSFDQIVVTDAPCE